MCLIKLVVPLLMHNSLPLSAVTSTSLDRVDVPASTTVSVFPVPFLADGLGSANGSSFDSKYGWNFS